MKKTEEEVAGFLGAALAGILLVALLALVVLPVGYVIKVLLKTGSRLLLALSIAFALSASLALLTQAQALIWPTILLGLACLVAARVVELRHASDASPDTLEEFVPSPFEEYRL